MTSRALMTRTATTVVRAARAVLLAVLYLLGLALMLASVLFLLVRPVVLPYRAR